MKIFAILIFLIVCILAFFTFLKYTHAPDTPTDLRDNPNSGNSIPQDITSTGFNFTAQEGVVDLGSGLYSFEEKLQTEGKGFSILYSANKNSYTIAIKKLPLSQHRENASKYFLELLKIDEKTACEMNVYVGVPYSVDAAYSSQNLGLSFCPESIDLK
jgi:hypothetical protein